MSTQQSTVAVGTKQQSRLVMSAKHLGEMLVAMLLGMVTLYPAWLVLVGAFDLTWLDGIEARMIAMATAMTIPMVAWMLHRGHSRESSVEMGAAMYAAFALPMPFVWVGVLDEMALMVIGHVLMVVFMLALVWRHTGEHH